MRSPHRLLALSMVLSLLFLIMVSCTSTRPEPPSGPLPLEEAVRLSTRYLLQKTKDSLKWSDFAKKIVAINQFRVNVTGTVPKVHKEIEKIMLEESKRFSEFDVRQLSKSIQNENYSIVGEISYEPRDKVDPNAKKLYHLDVSIINAETGFKEAKSKIWITDDLDISPPIEVPSASTGGPLWGKQQDIIHAPEGSKVGEPEDIRNIGNSCKQIADGNTALEKGKYEEAITAYEAALKDPKGQRLEVYNQLYSVYRRVGHNTQAERVFGQLVAFAVKNVQKLDVKFLFEFDSDNFVKLKEEEYKAQLRQIGGYFKDNNRCFNIIGHTSCTGTKEYNYILSKRRAETVQRLLGDYLPNVTQRTKPIGKGFDEAIVCSHDEEQGAIDRRVEFKIVDCPI